MSKIPASRSNTVLEDISAEIGLRATVLLAAWWGGKNIVVPTVRPERSVIAQIIGESATRRLSEVWGGEQLFIPRMTWLEEIRQARQVYNLRARGLTAHDISQIMLLTLREVEKLEKVGGFAVSAIANERGERKGNAALYEAEFPELSDGAGGRPKHAPIKAESKSNK